MKPQTASAAAPRITFTEDDLSSSNLHSVELDQLEVKEELKQLKPVSPCFSVTVISNKSTPKSKAKYGSRTPSHKTFR